VGTGPTIVKSLLLFQQLVKASPLFRSQRFPELGFGPLELLMKLRRDRFHDFARPFLALLEELVDLIPLLRREVQIGLEPAEEFEAHSARGPEFSLARSWRSVLLCAVVAG